MAKRGEISLRAAHQLAEIIAREIKIRPVLVGEHFFPGIALDGRIDRFKQGLFLCIIEARRGHDGAPVGKVNIDALFFQGRNVDAWLAFRRGNRQGPEFARLDLARPFAVAADARHHMAAHDRGKSFAAAVIADRT